MRVSQPLMLDMDIVASKLENGVPIVLTSHRDRSKNGTLCVVNDLEEGIMVPCPI
jgi:hypothetical protein